MARIRRRHQAPIDTSVETQNTRECTPQGAQRDAGSPLPDYGAELVIGRRFAPTRWRLHPGYQPHRAFAPVSATTFAHFSYSLRMKRPNSSGVPGIGTAPSRRMRSSTAGSASAATIAALSLAMISGGVRAGATKPNQPIDS
jgi:hypothetical protein